MKHLGKRYWISGIVLLAGMGIFAFVNGNCQSFWADELASIGFIRDGLSIPQVLDTYLYRENNLPLYPMILYVIYRIMPYGEKFLLIPSILFCLAGIVLLAMTVGKLKGRRAGFLALCMGVSSGVLLWQAAWEIRCYAMAFFLSALVLYTFAGKCLRPDRKRMLLFSAAVAFCFWTHWFACILLFFYGVTDLILVLLRKISWKHLLCYVPGCLLFFPWLFASFYFKRWGLDNYWSDVPEWKDMLWTVLFYLNGNRILWYLCLLTGAALCVAALQALRRPYSEDKIKCLLSAFCVVIIGWVIGVVFVFSRYIDPAGGLFVERYFTVVQPHILLITTLGLDYILDWADRLLLRSKDKPAGFGEDGVQTVKSRRDIWPKAAAWLARTAVIVLLVSAYVICYRDSYKAIRKPMEPYREAADYLVKEGKIWSDDCLFMGSNEFCALDGFVHYYFEKRGYKAPAHIVDSMVHSKWETRFYPNYTSLTKEELLSYDRIYCLRIHMGMDEEMKQLLEKYYVQVQTQDESGVEIWERKGSNSQVTERGIHNDRLYCKSNGGKRADTRFCRDIERTGGACQKRA